MRDEGTRIGSVFVQGNKAGIIEETAQAINLERAGIIGSTRKSHLL